VGGASEGDMSLYSSDILWVLLNILNLITDVFDGFDYNWVEIFLLCLVSILEVVFRCVRHNCEKRLFSSSCVSVRPSA
jgi:hypothetical protein